LPVAVASSSLFYTRFFCFFFTSAGTAVFFTLSLHDALPIFAFDADPKFFACLVRFESSSVPTTLPTAYDVYPLDGTEEDSKRTKIGRAVQQECRDRARMPSSA